MVGSIVTRAGPLPTPVAPAATLETLDALDLRPTFVGVSSALVRAAIDGNLSSFQPAMEDTVPILDDGGTDTRAAEPTEGADPTDRRPRHVGASVIRLTGRT